MIIAKKFKNKIQLKNDIVSFEIQRFADNNDTSALGTLKLVGNLITTLNLKNFVNDLSDVLNGIKENANPILEFIGEFLYKETDENDFNFDQKSRKTYMSGYATIIAKTVSITDDALSIVKAFDENKASVATISEKVASISNDILDIGNAISEINSLKLNSKKSKSKWILPILASGVSLVANVLSSMDGMTDKNKSDIAKSYFRFLKTAGNEIVKDAFSDAVATAVSKLSDEDIMGDVLKNTKFAKVFEETSKSLIKTIGIVFSFATTAFKGFEKAKKTYTKYTEDGIPENLAKRDAFIDAIALVVHDLANSYTKGLDDIAFKSLQTIASWITGKTPGNQGSYTEVIADLFKAFNFQNTGTEEDDFLFSGLNNEMVYGYDGNDYISNIASNVKIFGGHGNDVIFSRKDSGEYYSDLYGNSIIGGPGDDSIVSEGTIESLYGGKGADLIAVYGNSNSAYGEDDKDRIAVYGNNNWIYGGTDNDILILDGKASGNKIDGGAGNDTIAAFENANGNKINGGTGNDNIVIVNTKNQVIQYASGDGNDEIIGYDESDTISISGGSYKTSVSGQDIIIAVGNASIKLKEAKGKKIHINRDVVDTGDGTSTPKTEDLIIYPGFWSPSNIIRGTAGNDSINNTIDNVIIEALAGDDSISNSGKNVTIDSGIGNDYVYNKGPNSKIINGSGNNHTSIFNDFKGTNTSIYGSESQDYVISCADDVFVDVGDGNDTISNIGANISIFGGAGNDSISSRAKKSIIDAGLQEDYISNEGALSTIYGGLGNDSIINTGEENVAGLISQGGDSVKIYGGDGDDFIKNTSSKYAKAGNDIFIDGENGNDKIYNEGNKVTINSGEGNDSIYNSGNDVTINGGSGNDTVQNRNSKVTINGGDGEDDLQNNASLTMIDGGKGNDDIRNYGENVTINGGEGADYIYNSGNNIKIFGGTGKDTIRIVSTKNLTIYGGADSDSIENSSSYSYIDGGTEEDAIDNKGESVTIDGGAGNDSIKSAKSNNKIIGGTGNDIIIDLGSQSSINGGEGNDKIEVRNTQGGSVIEGGNGNDTIFVLGVKNITTVHSGSGNDSINSSGSNLLIYGDSGKNRIISSASSSTIIGGIDDDYIFSEGKLLNISGGKGNDTINIEKRHGQGGNIYQYADGDGNDVIDGLDESDTLQIIGASYTTVKSGYDTIIKVGNGSIKIKNTEYVNGEKIKLNIQGTLAADIVSTVETAKNITNTQSNTIISGTKYADTVTNYGWNTTIDGGTGDDIINNFKAFGDEGNNVSISGGAGNDSIVSTATKVTIDGGDGADYIYSSGTNHTVIGGKGNDLINLATSAHYTNIKYSSGDGNDIIYGLDSGDTLQITGAEYTTVKSGSDLIIGVGNNSISVVGGANVAFKINGTLKGNIDGGISVKNSIVTAAKTFAGKEINLADYDATKVNATEVTQAISIIGTTAANSIKGGKGADTITGGAGNDTVSLGGGKDIYIYSGGKDVIQDYAAGTDKIKLTGAPITSSSISGNDVVLKVGSGSITVKKGKGKKITVIDDAGKETTQIYPIVETNSLPSGWKADTTGKTVTATITSAGNIDLTKTYGTKVEKVDASKITKAVSIVGNTKANSIKGGKGADTISGGAGNDTVSLGGGKDVYIYSGGNDFIQDYTEGLDKIKVASGSITAASVSSSNVILKTTNGNITVKNGKGKKITVIDSSGNETSNIYPLETLPVGITVKNSVVTAAKTFTGNKIDLADYQATKVNASAVTQAVSIVGTTANNSLKGGKGNDSIFGGAGNDTVSLGGGKDVYIYSAGNDLIRDYTEGLDKISLASGTISGASVSGNDVVLKVGSGSITVKNGKGKNITILDSKGTATVKNYDQSNGKEIENLYGSGVTLVSGGSGNDTIWNSEFFVSINGGSGDDWIINNRAENVTINGGKGDDAICNNYQENTKIFYNSGDGNDTIYGINESDTIDIAGAKYSSMRSGSDFKINVGIGSILIKGGMIVIPNVKGILDEDNTSPYVKINNSGSNTIVAGTSFADEIWNSGSNVKIISSDGDDLIFFFNSFTTIKAGRGNDEIRDNSPGYNTYIYNSGDGNDTILGIHSSDTLQITGDTYDTMKSGSDVIFKVGNGSITVENGVNIGFNINFKSSSGSNSRTLDLLYDNNFITDELQIDDISEVTETNYSVGQIENSVNSNKLVMDSIVAATSFDKK